jgi:ABC-type glycerol-3-phosphate transport system substrate-binding protein
MSRRQFIRVAMAVGIGAGASGVLSACATAPQPAVTAKVEGTTAPAATAAPAATTAPTAAPTPTNIVVGQGNIEIAMWVQDFGPVVNAFQSAAEAYSKKSGKVKVTVQSIPYGDLQAKVIPSVAAGNEDEIIMGYTNWYIATDVSKLFLPLDEIFGGRGELEKTIFPAAMTVMDTPGNKLFYIPYLTGLRGVVTTVNVGHYNEKSIDYTKFTTYEDFVGAAKTLTIRDGDTIKRAGLSSWAAALVMLKSWIWQQGGEFFSSDSGKWNLSSPEGEAALQRIQDIYQKDKVCNLDIASREYAAFLQGVLSTQLEGAWTLGVIASSNPDMKLDSVVTPKLTGAKNATVYPDHTAVLTLSKRLTGDDQKREASIGLAKALMSPDALISILDQYSGSLMSKALYDDPRVAKTKYGAVSKRIAEGVWPNARYPHDHVADQGPALTELQRALTKEISIKAALGNADTYLNEQESQARERLKS